MKTMQSMKSVKTLGSVQSVNSIGSNHMENDQGIPAVKKPETKINSQIVPPLDFSKLNLRKWAL